MLISILIAAATAWGGAEAAETVEARVIAERLEVLDEAEASGYVVATLKQGETVRVRPAESPRPGWLAIDPPGTVFCWVDASALKGAGPESGASRHVAKVRATTAVRSANPAARLPGPPRGSLKPGERVLLVDRKVLELGEKDPQRWRAIAPPAGRAYFVPASAVAWLTTDAEPTPEVRATAFTAAEDPELRRIDSMLLAETTGQPVENWRLTPIRSAYESLAKQVEGDSERRGAVEVRLKRLEGLERAASTARRFVEAASKGRNLDEKFSKIESRLSSAERDRSRAYDAVGFIQPSAKMYEGRKLYALIGREGTVAAYLDMPPGLDPEPMTAHRVGLRGRPRYDADLKARIIAVRDMVDLEARE